ncbi:MAG TPA: hypothetical protein VFT87_01620, partial [Candidatus Saccharimonadales bacterium]|nr:hypothetical protein [Candidatus Saccharimonadales bacterium]
MKKTKHPLRAKTPKVDFKSAIPLAVVLIVAGAVLGGMLLLTRNESQYKVESQEAAQEIRTV